MSQRIGQNGQNEAGAPVRAQITTNISASAPVIAAWIATGRIGPHGARRPTWTAPCSASGTPRPNATHTGQKYPPPVAVQITTVTNTSRADIAACRARTDWATVGVTRGLAVGMATP